MTSPTGRSPLLVAFPLAVFAATLVVHGLACDWNVIDDALILCRVAANMADGIGPFFIPGVRFESW